MIPDDVEKIIMTKEDYDRNVEQLLYDKINAEQEVERLNNIIKETIDKLNEMKISILIDTQTGIEIDSKFIDGVFETIKFLEENKELKGVDKE